MDYNRIMQEILNIGEELLKSGAEIFRVEDSLYRMCRSYGFVRSDVYASQINIQMTVETPEGEIITQIRYIEMTSPHYDKLDQLNNLSRYVCANTPKQAEIHERYEKLADTDDVLFPGTADCLRAGGRHGPNPCCFRGDHREHHANAG